MTRTYKKAEDSFLKRQGELIKTNKYEGIICGFHFPWDDNDGFSLIVAITKNLNGLENGIKYRIRGDVYRTHKCNPLGYDFIHQ